jgi:hypothetical protein
MHRVSINIYNYIRTRWNISTNKHILQNQTAVVCTHVRRINIGSKSSWYLYWKILPQSVIGLSVGFTTLLNQQVLHLSKVLELF